MLHRVTEQALRALHQLSRNPLWSEVDKMFEAELAEVNRKLADAADLIVVGQLQGRAKFLYEFRDLLRDAEKASLLSRGSKGP